MARSTAALLDGSILSVDGAAVSWCAPPAVAVLAEPLADVVVVAAAEMVAWSVAGV
ncbi:hypothetical protein [Intrasporangium chromatireducens]|uniref:hypothetical protein n=1 Tax=Intrasporangium chromatireducens TaxID=1386088 RepID=UPI0004AC6BAF|nr:hypothetical protein [Intrasporangium chromatireducens]